MPLKMKWCSVLFCSIVLIQFAEPLMATAEQINESASASPDSVLVQTKPETTKPETTKPETTKPETTRPETTKPETTRPATTKPATTKPATTASTQSDAQKASTSDGVIVKLIDGMVTRVIHDQKIPGYALTVLKNDKVYFQNGYGVRDVEAKETVDKKTVFGLAALTKTFTAFALLKLVDEGKVNLDDTLDKYVSDLSDAWKGITLRQLATMTAGIPVALSDGERPWSQEFPLIQKEKLLFKPGSKFQYSNLSYRILGTVIEKASGKTYIEYLDETVFKPLSMTQTGIISRINPVKLSSPYEEVRGKDEEVFYSKPDITYAAGMLFSSSEDLSKYCSVLLHQLVLSKDSYKTMWNDRPTLNGKVSAWGYGWNSRRNQPAYGNRWCVSMDGGLPGVAASILLFPDDNVAVIGLSNIRKPTVFQLSRTAAQMVFHVEDADDTTSPVSDSDSKKQH